MPDESGSSIWTLGVSAAGAGASISWTFEAKRTAGADVFITVWGEDGSSLKAFDPSVLPQQELCVSNDKAQEGVHNAATRWCAQAGQTQLVLSWQQGEEC